MSGSARAVCAIALVAAVTALQHPAVADRETRRDDTETSHSDTDIARVVHAHGPSRRIMRHEIRFDGNPSAESITTGVSLFFRFRSRSGKDVRRELVVDRNPGGGLYGAFLTPNGKLTGYTRAWREEEGSKLIVEFSVAALGRPKNERYRWHAWSTLGVGEFNDPCVGEEQGPPVCKDRAPARGSIVHRL